MITPVFFSGGVKTLREALSFIPAAKLEAALQSTAKNQSHWSVKATVILASWLIFILYFLFLVVAKLFSIKNPFMMMGMGLALCAVSILLHVFTKRIGGLAHPSLSAGVAGQALLIFGIYGMTRSLPAALGGGIVLELIWIAGISSPIHRIFSSAAAVFLGLFLFLKTNLPAGSYLLLGVSALLMMLLHEKRENLILRSLGSFTEPIADGLAYSLLLVSVLLNRDLFISFPNPEILSLVMTACFIILTVRTAGKFASSPGSPVVLFFAGAAALTLLPAVQTPAVACSLCVLLFLFARGRKISAAIALICAAYAVYSAVSGSESGTILKPVVLAVYGIVFLLMYFTVRRRYPGNLPG